MECPYCLLEESDQKVVFSDELVRFLQDHRYQGALKHSGVIIPLAHRETVFDLTEPELLMGYRWDIVLTGAHRTVRDDDREAAE